jgi:hypothetical protein
LLRFARNDGRFEGKFCLLDLPRCARNDRLLHPAAGGVRNDVQLIGVIAFDSRDPRLRGDLALLKPLASWLNMYNKGRGFAYL